MVKSKATGEFLVSNQNQNLIESNNFMSPPLPEPGRGRRGTRRTAGKGRGRASLPGSPAVSNIAAEEEIALRDIPSLRVNDGDDDTTLPAGDGAVGAVGGCGPAALSKLAVNDCSESENEEDIIINIPRGQGKDRQGEFLAHEIAREKEAQHRLIQEKKLAQLRRQNTELKSAIQSEAENIPNISLRQVTGPATHGARQRLPLLSEASGGAGGLPTLHQVGSVDAFPSLDQLRSRPDLQRLVDQQVREDNLWSRQEVTEGNIQQNLIGNFGAPPPCSTSGCIWQKPKVRIWGDKNNSLASHTARRPIAQSHIRET